MSAEQQEMQPMNIYQKLAKIRKPVEVLQKNKAGYGYRYVTEDLILAKITGLMDKLGVSLIPNIVAGTTNVAPYHYVKTKILKSGEVVSENVNEILVHADMEWHWVNNDNPEDRVVVPWTLVGQQGDASQAFGSGLSYSSRYFMLKYFNVATSEDDPDNWRSMQKEAEQAENREVAAAIVDQIHGMVTAYIADHESDRPKISAIIKKYAKEKGKPSTNYFAITNPDLANKLMAELAPICGGGDNAA
ncbi:MAG: ERF family protein [Clostridia bacterium]|nr:ERF family protein [Clostridia bacterium]